MSPAEPSTRAAGLRLAVTTLTVLPLRPGRVDRAAARDAMTLAPLVGVALGLVAAAAVFGLRVLLGDTRSALLPAVAGIAVLAWLSRALHLDGLADTADGLGVRGGPDAALAAMRRPEVGAFGLVTVVLVVLGQVAALQAAVAAERGTVSVVLAAATGRCAAALACRPSVPAARPDGLGALVAGSTPVARSLVAVFVLGAAGAAGAWLDDGAGAAGSARAVLALLAGLVAAEALRRRVVARLGGITGDVLGAQVEVATLAALLVMAVG